MTLTTKTLYALMNTDYAIAMGDMLTAPHAVIDTDNDLFPLQFPAQLDLPNPMLRQPFMSLEWLTCLKAGRASHLPRQRM